MKKVRFLSLAFLALACTGVASAQTRNDRLNTPGIIENTDVEYIDLNATYPHPINHSGEAGQWHTVLWDEFNNLQNCKPDPQKWKVGTQSEINTVSWYLEDNYDCDANNLKLVSDEELRIKYHEGMFQARDYTSAKITSKDPLPSYGFFEMRAKIPTGKYCFPAFWLYAGGDGDVLTGNEVDIMESEGNAQHIWCTYHMTRKDDTSRSAQTVVWARPGQSFADQFVTYAIKWEPTRMVWYVNNRPVKVISNDDTWRVPLAELALLIQNPVDIGRSLNMAEVFPNEMVIDFVKVYQRYDYDSGAPNFTINEQRSYQSTAPVQVPFSGSAASLVCPININLISSYATEVQTPFEFQLEIEQVSPPGFTQQITLQNTEVNALDGFDLVPLLFANNFNLHPNRVYKLALTSVAGTNARTVEQYFKTVQCMFDTDLLVNGESDNSTTLQVAYNGAGPALMADVSGSTSCDNRYYLSMQQVVPVGNGWTAVGALHDTWINATTGNVALHAIDIAQEVGFAVDYGQYIKVTAATGSQNQLDEEIFYVYIEPCTNSMQYTINDIASGYNVNPVQFDADEAWLFDGFGSRACNEQVEIQIFEGTSGVSPSVLVHTIYLNGDAWDGAIGGINLREKMRKDGPYIVKCNQEYFIRMVLRDAPDIYGPQFRITTPACTANDLSLDLEIADQAGPIISNQNWWIAPMQLTNFSACDRAVQFEVSQYQNGQVHDYATTITGADLDYFTSGQTYPFHLLMGKFGKPVEACGTYKVTATIGTTDLNCQSPAATESSEVWLYSGSTACRTSIPPEFHYYGKLDHNVLLSQETIVIGCDLVIPDGFYFNVSNCTVFVEKGGSIIVEDGGQFVANSTVFSGCNGASWDGVQLYGDYPTGLINTISNCSFSGADQALSHHGSKSLVVQGCTFLGGNAGIVMNQCESFTLQDNYFYATKIGISAIDIPAVGNHVLTNNYYESCTKGFYGKNSINLSMEPLFVVNCDRGLRFEDCQQVTVTGAEFYNNTVGIGILNCDGFVATANLHSGDDRGMVLGNCVDVEVSNNTYTGTSRAMEIGDSGPIEITSNTMQTFDFGIVMTRATEVEISQNTLLSGSNGIYLIECITGPAAAINDNTISNCVSGVLTSQSNFTSSYNTIESCQNGIEVSKSNYVVVTESYFEGNSLHSVRIEESNLGGGSAISNNTFVDDATSIRCTDANYSGLKVFCNQFTNQSVRAIEFGNLSSRNPNSLCTPTFGSATTGQANSFVFAPGNTSPFRAIRSDAVQGNCISASFYYGPSGFPTNEISGYNTSQAINDGYCNSNTNKRDPQLAAAKDIVDFELVPNPASDHVVIRFGSAPQSQAQIEVLDFLGTVILRTKSNATSANLNIEGFAQGVYLIKVTVEGQTSVKRLVVE